MIIDREKRTLNATIDKWNFEADHISNNSIKIFIYSKDPSTFGNKFVGFYNPQTEDIKPLYYNSHMDYRGKEPTNRQKEKIKKYCDKLLKNIAEG